MCEGHPYPEILDIHKALALKLRIPEWILFGFRTEAEWLLTSLFKTREEMEADAWYQRHASYFNLDVDFMARAQARLHRYRIHGHK